jgi:hypothetical protein
MRLRTLVLAATSALLLTGCGGGGGGTAATPSPSPTPTEDARTGEEVVADAVAALRESGAVRAQGTFTQDGTEGGLDMHLQDDGAVGSLSMDGQEIQLLVVGDEAYVQAPAEFWASFGTPEAFAQQIAGQWLLMPAAEAADFGPLSLSGIADELVDPESGVREEVETGQVDGQDVLVVTTEDGSTMSVLADGSDYPVRVENTGEESPGVIELSEFGERQEITAPADFIDLEDLGA